MSRFDAGREYIEESIRRKESTADADALAAARLVSSHNFSEHAYAALVRRIASAEKTITAERRILGKIDEAMAEADRRQRVEAPKEAAAAEAHREELRLAEFRKRLDVALSMARWSLEKYGTLDESDAVLAPHFATIRAALTEPDIDLGTRMQIGRVVEQLNTKRKKAS